MDYFLDKKGYRFLTKCISVIVIFTFLFNQLVVAAYAGPIPQKIDEPDNTGKIPIEEDINRQQTSYFVPTDTLYMEPSDELSLEKIDISELTFEEKTETLENNDKFPDTKLFSYLTSLNVVFNTCGIAALSALLAFSDEKEIVLNSLVFDINNNNLYRIGDKIAYSLGALKDSAASFGYDLKAVQVDPCGITDILSYNDGIIAHTKEGHYKYVKFPFEIDPDTLTGYILCENFAKVYKEIDKTSILNIYGTASWLDVQVNYNSVTADSDIENGVITDSDLIALLTGYVGIDLPNSASQSSMLEDIRGTARRVNISDNYVKGELENQVQYDALLNDMIYLISNDVDLDEDGIVDNKDEINIVADAYLSVLAYEFEADSNDISLEYIKKDGDTYIFTAKVNNEYHKVRFDEDGNYISFIDFGGNSKDTTIEIVDPEDSSVLKTKTFTYTVLDGILTETKSVSFDISGYSVTSKYDSNYNLIYYQDKHSEITSYTYNANNNLTAIIYPDAINEYFEYTYEGDEITKIVYLNNEYNNLIVTEYYNYEKGYIIKSRTGQGTYIDSSISYEENALDSAKTVYSYLLEADILTQTGHIQYTDSQGSSIDYYVINKYDGDDNLISATEKLSPSEYADLQVVDSKTTVYTYDADGDILSVIDGEGKGYRYEYVKDSQKRKLEIRALGLEYGTVTVETYDVEGRLLTYNEGEGHWDDINGVVVIDLMPETPKVKNSYTDVRYFNEDEDGTWLKKTDLRGGLDFDGTGDYVEVPDSPSLNVTDTVTVEAWIKKTEQDYAHDTMLSTDAYRFQIDASNHVLWGWTDGTYNSSTSSSGTITLNEWNHIVGVKNGNDITFFLNGQKIGTGSVWHSRAVASLNIGSDGLSGIGGSDDFDGSISEIRVYSRALNDGEVYSNYLGNVAQNGLILNHNYTRNHGRDLTVNNNDGSNFGAEYLTNILEETGTYNTDTGEWAGNEDGKNIKYIEETDDNWTRFEEAGSLIEFSGEFDGTSDYVEVAGSPSLNVTDTLTVEVWINKASQDYTYDTILAADSYRFQVNSDKNLVWDWTDGTNRSERNSWGSITLGEWNHVVGVKSGSTITFYINGQECGINTVSYSRAVTSLNIGADGLSGIGGADYFDGSISEVRVYNRVLSEAEILSNYQGAVIGDSIILEHNYSAGSGEDLSGNGNDGKLPDAEYSVERVVTEIGKYDTEDKVWYGSEKRRYFNGDKSVEYVLEDGIWVKKTDLRGGLDFDGSSDYVEIAGSPSLNVTDTVTVEAWIKKASQGYAHNTVLSTDSYRFQIDTSNNILWEWTDGTYGSGACSSNTMALNEWNHIVGVKSGSNITFYLNGEGIGTGSVWHSRAVTSLLIGSDGLSGIGGADNFDGSISEVRVYNRALDDGEVYSNYLGNVAQNGLILNHNYTRNHARDLTGNGNDGSNFGAKYLTNILEETGNYNSETDEWIGNEGHKPIRYVEALDGSWIRETGTYGALEFSGNSDYVEVAGSPSLNVTDTLTVEVWINKASQDWTFDTILATDSYRFQINSAKNLVWDWTDGTNRSERNSWGSITLGEWNHVVGVKSGSTITFYINGQECGINTVSYSRAVTALNIGSDGLSGIGGADYFDGSISEVRMYNRALSESEVLSNYQGNVSTSGLVLEHNYPQVTDLSGNGNDGAVYGAQYAITEVVTETGIYNPEIGSWYSNSVNESPLADAGINESVDEGETVTLNGICTDPEGDALTYLWTQISGPTVNINNADSPIAGFTAPEVTEDTGLVFRLTVSDGENSAYDNVKITVRNKNSAKIWKYDRTFNYAFTKHVTDTDAEGNDIDYIETTIFCEDDNILYFKDREGNIESYTYDLSGRVASIWYKSVLTPQNEKINYVYSLANGIETVQETVIVYRDLQASSIKEQTVITRSYERNALGDVFKYTQNTSYPDSDKDTVYVEKNYDADGKLVSEVKQAGTEEAETTTYLYNSDDELETITYPGGRTETYVYTKDGKGRLTQKTLTVNDTDITGTPFSHTETTDYNPETGEVTSFTDKDGNITTYSYVKNTRSDVVENTVINDYSDDPENLKRKVTIDIYDADGNLISHSEEVGGTGAKITTYTYNDDGTTESVTYPLEDGETQSKIVAYEYTYDSKGKLTVYVQNITEPDGTQYSISEEYNADGNIVKTIDKDGAVSTYSYLRSLTGKLLEKTVTELDSGQNPVYIEKFDGRGNLIYTKDVEKNLEKEFTYIYENEYTDEEYLKTLIETVTQNVPDAQAITYTAAKNFNAEGQIIEVSSDINSDVKTTSYSYYGESETGGKEGDLKQVIDAKGNKTEYFYEYDAVEDFLTKKTVKYYENNDGALVLKYTLEQQYDVKGRLISDIDKYGVTKTYQYTVTDDVVTQVIESVNYTDENSNTIFYSTTKNYSADGKKLVGETLPDGTTKTYTYDAETGDLLESTGNEVTITYTYNVDTGVLESSLEFNNKGTAEAADDIQKLTLYFGDKDKEQIKEIRTFPAGADTSYKPIIRELFHYNSSGVLYRTIKKELKDEFKGTVGTIVESEYKEILETIYGVYNGKVRKKREIGREAREDYIYDEDGILSESVVTNGIYYSKTYKEYNFDGDVIKITKKNGLESIVTDVSYVKNSIGLISDKTETVTYKKYDENGSLLESEVISVTSYEYYGKLADDKTLYPVATKNHEIKTMISGGKTHVYEYTYDANGYIEMSGETVTWSEGANSYNVVSYKKFNQKGDIISSIDEDGTYSEYFYSSEAENEMGGRVQTQKVFYKFKNPADETLGYELYRVTSFGEVDITGLSVSEFRRTYDFENDLVEVVKKNSDGSEIDDQITSYIYEKDQYGSVLKKYETESDRIGLKVYEYDLKGSLVSETDRNGVKTPYSYTRDSIDGHVVSVETTSSIYSGYLTTTLMDEVGNVTSVVDTNGITKTYTYEKDTGGILTGKTEHVSKIENTVMVLDYTDHYSYTIDEEISSFTDKNNVIRTNEYKCDGYGNIEYVTVTASWNAGTKSKITRKEYNLDGTESSVTYINNPADSGDDVIKTFSYTYDSINGTLIQMVETDSRFSAGTTYEYNFLGDIASVTSPNGIITIYTYERDIKGNLIKRYEENSLYADSVEMSGFDIYNNKVSFTNSNGYIFDYENTYDLSGNLIQVIETHDRYGANDVLLWSSTETKIYNILGRITSITDKNGITLTYTYDTNGQGEVTASYETDGRYTGQVIRNFNSLTSDISSITNRMGHITDFTYEYSSVHGGITGKTETVFLGGTTAYNFDGYGRINSITDKFGKVVSITPDFDTYGNMYKRTLTWTEDLNNVTPDFEEQEFYSVDGDLVRRIDYTGKEFRYQYEKDSVGSLKYMTSIESSREKYTLLDTNPVVSITSNGSGSYLPLLCDDKIAYHSTVSWADANDPASFVIDLGDNAFEYNAMKLYLYQGEGRAYKYKIFTASDLNSAWTMVDNKTDVFYSDIQESEFDTTNNRYVMIQGSDASPVGTLRLEIQEVEFYKKEQVETLNLVTSEYDTNGRVVSKTGTTGETVYYSYEIGDKGEVVKVYERLTPETTVGVLLGVPIKSENVSLMGAYPSQDPNEPLLHIYDDHLGTRGGFNWYGESTPGSLILDLTDDNSNIDDLSAFGIQVRTSEDDIWFGYKVYYATAENPNTWIELLDRSNHKIGMQDRWFVEKFDAPVSGKYIRLQGGPSWQTGNFQIEEIEVYREEQRTNALKVKELDEYGKTITEKNALMLAWEENESLQQIFPNAGKKSVVAGYWNDKSITEWARMVGAWEDPRIKAYLSDFDNKTYPAIESAFERGDVNDKLLNVSYVNNSEQLGSPLNIIDGIFTTRDYIKWTDDNNPGYYLIEFSEDTQIDKIRLKLYDDNHRKTFKYRIYTSLDGQTWSDAIILNDTDFVTYWQEHRFENVTTRYLKIEGAGCRLTYDPVYAPQNYVDIKQLYLEDIMIFDTSLSSSSPREYAENALKDWAKKLGFRTDAELIKFAKTDLVTDEPELKTYTYMLDDNGTVRRMSEASLFTGASLKFFDAKGRLIEEVESKITETIVTPITEWQGESFCEYDTYGNLISKKDILAVIWEENADMRKSFVTPDALATDPYEGYYTLKDWAYNIGRFEDSRLADFDNHDPYLVYYSYDRDENGTLRNMAKTVNMKQQTLTWYDAIGQFIGEETNSLNVTRNIHTYAYHMNGNLSKTTTVKSGYENRNCESFYNSVGDMVLYQDDRAENFFYRYTYTSDRWNNAVKVYVKPAHPDYGNPWETMFLTSEETLVQEEAEERIIEYFRAMVYREPTADELALHLADWEKTGFTNLARELIRQSDEYKNGDFITFAQQAENLRNSRIAGLQSAFTIAASNKQTLLDGLNNIVTQISANYQALQTVYQSKKDDNDKKYIKEIYRNILGREGTEDEINTELIYMRANNKTLEDMRARVQAYSEYTDRKAAIQNIINALYDSSTDTGLLKDYLNSEDKYDYITNTLGYVVNREFLHNITSDQIQAIISWLATQDNHFGRSAVQALYKQLDSAGIQNIPDTDSLLKELIFLDIVTGVITEDTQGLLLISMHAIKKAAKAYGLDLYGTAYDADEFLSKFDEIPGYSAIAHYNNNHFINVTGVVKDGDVITHVIVTNGYINGVEQTKTIKIDEFRENYEGKILSVEKSNYDKRLTDDQLKNIKGAGWLSKFWKKVKKIFKKIFRALKKILKYIIEPIKQFIKAIKFAIEEGKWGRVFGAIGVLIIGSVMSFLPGLQPFAFTLISTAMSMATAICYGQYANALKSFGLGIVALNLQLLVQFSGIVKGIFTKIGDAIKAGIAKITEFVGGILKGALTLYEKVVTAFHKAGDWLSNEWGLFGDWTRNVVGGFTTSGISRYFSEEINKVSNWGAKIGIALGGALLIMPFNAFSNPQWDTDWCPGLDERISHTLLEVQFDALNTLISQPIYKELDESLGEEWYADLLRTSVFSVVGAGLNIVKGVIHKELGDPHAYIKKALDTAASKYGNRPPDEEDVYNKDYGYRMYKDSLTGEETRVFFNKNNALIVTKLKTGEIKVELHKTGDGLSSLNSKFVVKDGDRYIVSFGDEDLILNEEFKIVEKSFYTYIEGEKYKSTVTVNPDNFEAVEYFLAEEYVRDRFGDILTADQINGLVVDGQIKLADLETLDTENSWWDKWKTSVVQFVDDVGLKLNDIGFLIADSSSVAGAFMEGSREGLWNETVGLAKLLYGAGKEIVYSAPRDIIVSYGGGNNFESALFTGVYDMQLQGMSTWQMAGKTAYDMTWRGFYNLGDQIVQSAVYGWESGDWKAFDESMTAVAVFAATSAWGVNKTRSLAELKKLANVSDDAFVHVTTREGAGAILEEGLRPTRSGYVTKWKYVKNINDPTVFNTKVYKQSLWPARASRFNNGAYILEINPTYTPRYYSPFTNRVNGFPQWIFEESVISANEIQLIKVLTGGI